MRANVDLSQQPPTVTFPATYNAAADLVDRQLAEGRGERVAYIVDSGVDSGAHSGTKSNRYTYAQLAERVNRAGSALAALGVEPEQRVLMVMQDDIDFPSVFLGAMKLGAIAVPINTMLRPDDYGFFLRDSRARALVVSEALLPQLATALANRPATLRHVIVAGASPSHPQLAALMAAASPMLEASATSPDDVAFWLYSSGSTGTPKGAIHLHAHLMRTSALYAQNVLQIRQSDLVYSAAKLFFAYGLGNALTFPLSVGATALLCPERPTPATVARLCREHRPTIFCGVPTLFAALLADQDIAQHGLSPALRVSTSAGEGLPRAVGQAWRARFGTDILDGIGSTELLHIFLSNRSGDVRYGTTGRAVPGYDLELRDERGHVVAEGEAGALWVRGETACVGYYNQRQRSLATFVGAWTRTGDRYERDADGYYTYAGRDDDMLKVGGIWVSPFEVESALVAHEAVLEVAVVGVQDDAELVKPKAFVVLAQGHAGSDVLADELKRFVRDKIAAYKYPRWIEFVAELPKTATGKIQRYKLR